MRHWLVRPNLMCEKHLLGEHVECHMFQGSMRGNISLEGYYEKHLFFGPSFLLHRHTELEALILGHQSPMTTISIAEAVAPWPGMLSRKTYPDIGITKEMIKASRMDLVSRCGVCRSKHLNEKRQGRSHTYNPPSIYRASPVAVGSGSVHSEDTLGGDV